MKKLWGVFAAVFIVLSLFLSACAPTLSTSASNVVVVEQETEAQSDYVATSAASCAFVVGNGRYNNDTSFHDVIYPGQRKSVSYYETVTYVPCNSRNYIINDGTTINANGDVVGDRAQLIKATTSTGVPIVISVRAFWTLNQTMSAMQHFYNVCFKYQCASSNDVGGGSNFSTPGWNGMLAENFGPTLDITAKIAAYTMDDSIWALQDPSKYEELGDKMSAAFADQMQASFGYTEDLFCGSGNSNWQDPSNPGVGTFTCSPVRIAVDYVHLGEITFDSTAPGVTGIFEQRLKNAQLLYGNNAGFWLGLQDTIAKCKEAGTYCVVSMGADGNPTVNLP